MNYFYFLFILQYLLHILLRKDFLFVTCSKKKTRWSGSTINTSIINKIYHFYCRRYLMAKSSFLWTNKIILENEEITFNWRLGLAYRPPENKQWKKVKVHIFWEGHKILRNLHHRFVLCSNGQIYGGDFAKFVAFLKL